ncbi:MAG: hypothetical protein GXP08_17200 [Gammaproteobacteria bacterium]|nr:hypothetical protein [Gammaproteobacteria bacterium]
MIDKSIGFLLVTLFVLVSCSNDEQQDEKQVTTKAQTDAVQSVRQDVVQKNTQVQQWISGWKEASSLVAPRAGAAVVGVGRYIYVIGGIDGRDFVGITEYAKINEDGSLSAWQQTSVLNEERGFVDAATKDGYIYVVGGGNGPNGKNLLRTVERAKVNEDGSLGLWKTLDTGMVMPRRCSKTFIKDNFIYSLGGFAGALLDNVERAEILPDGNLGPWTMEEDTMTIPRYVNSVKASHGNAYVLGGHDETKGVGITDVEWTIPVDDGGAKDWKKTSPLQTGRYGLASASHKDSVYAVGGLTGLEYLSSIEVANIKESGELGDWRYTTPLSEPRATFSVLIYKDWIYAIGGTNQDRYLNTVEYASINENKDIGFYGTSNDAKWYQAKLDKIKNTKPRLPNHGTVKAVRQASMYTYAQVVNESGVMWVAGPKSELSVNDNISFSKGVSMSNFYSKELQQSFPLILFVSNIQKQ